MQFKTILLLLTLLQDIYSFDVKCNVTKQIITFTVSSVKTNNNVTGLDFFFKSPDPRAPWLSQNGSCNVTQKLTLVCPIKGLEKTQNFRIDLKTVGKVPEEFSRELWFYDCFEKHGVKKVESKSVSWNEFTIAWNYYSHDEHFLRKNTIKVTDNHDQRVLFDEPFKDQQNKRVFTYGRVTSNRNYTVCIKTTFTRLGSGEKKEASNECTYIMTTDKPRDKSPDLKTPLLAVGIGVLCLVLLCLLFVIYNKKCKQGGDHDYDMNKDVTLVDAEATNDGEELQVYTNGQEKEKILSNGAEDKEEA